MVWYHCPDVCLPSRTIAVPGCTARSLQAQHTCPNSSCLWDQMDSRAPESTAPAAVAAQVQLPGRPELPELPDAAVACILHHVPLQHRLTCCALVCRAWVAAAVAVPAVIDVDFTSSERSGQVQHWLAKHGGAVAGLTGAGTQGGDVHLSHPLQLPVQKFTQLRSLTLSYLKVELPLQGVSTDSSAGTLSGSALTGASSSTASSLGSAATAATSPIALPQLQELKLLKCQLSEQLLSQLLSATAVSKLHWWEVNPLGESAAAWSWEASSAQGPPTIWQQLQLLPKLSELQLVHGSLETVDVAPVSNLQHLQHLCLQLQDHDNAAFLGLQSDAVRFAPRADLSAELCLARLAGLHSFYGERVRMQPSMLRSLTELQVLRLQSPIFAAASEEQGARELLAALQHLTKLQHLQLSDCHLLTISDGLNMEPQPQQQGPQQQPEGDGCQCFSGLTASTQLTALVLVSIDSMPVPKAALQHMFNAGRVLPSLRLLRLTGCPVANLGLLPPCVEPAQIAMIAASCPALQELELRCVTDADFDRSCLAQLHAGVKTSVLGFEITNFEPS